MGVILKKDLEGEPPEGFIVRNLPARRVLRLSGSNRMDERKQAEVLRQFLRKHDLAIDSRHPAQLSGQSFSLYQWDLKDGSLPPSRWSRFEEWTYQLKDNMVLALLGSVMALGLLGTQQIFLFAIGVFLITYLSGACKFMFLHQREDEAEEIHLQNY